MTIRVKEGKGSIRANGKNHGAGSILTFDKEEEKRLVKIGVAEYVEKPKKDSKGEANKDPEKDPNKNPDNPDNNPDSNPDENGSGPDTGHPDVK